MVLENNPNNYKAMFIESIKKFPNSKKWTDGIFGAIKTVSNTSVGNVGEDFIKKYAKSLGFKVIPSDTRTSWDIQIEGINYELKTATEDIHTKFQFNHFRTHRKYDAVICLGVSPNNLYFCVLTKKELLEQKLVSMEKGANASYKWTQPKENLLPIEKFKEMIDEFTTEFNEEKFRAKENRIKREQIKLGNTKN